MKAITRWVGTLAVMTMLAAACGGGGSGDGASADPSGGAVQSVDPGASAGASQPAASEPVASEPAAGGGGDVCGLVTIAEVEGVFGVSGVTQGLFVGPPDTCDYQLDGAPFAAVVLTTIGATSIFDAIAGDAASESVSGLGDRALYNSQTLNFLIQKGDRLLSISTFDPSKTDAERFELMKQMGAIADDRM
jgi:hypothetical protein